jgi:protein gp37
MAKTKIPWCDVTINPFPGCRKVSPGCENCYAEAMAKRLKAMGQSKYENVVNLDGWTGRSSCAGINVMRVPGKGKRVFVESMGDLFYERNPFVGGIDRVYSMMLDQPQHTFLVLTKRPERALEYYQGVDRDQEECYEPNPIAYAPHIWLGTTCENQEWADKRIPILMQIPAAVRFVSLEPLLGPVNLRRHICGWMRCRACGAYLKMPKVGLPRCDCPRFMGGRLGTRSFSALEVLDWVIVGCESGPKRRECQQYWVVDVVKQCHQANVPVFVKQISDFGEVVHDPSRIGAYLGERVEDIQQWPKGLEV